VKVIEVNDFQSLESEWAVLLKKNTVNDNIFSTWEWLSSWWHHFGENRKLLLLMVEDAQKIVGIAPFMISKHKLRGPLHINKIEFIGAPHSDYHNFIFSKKKTDWLLHVLNYLNTQVGDWDWIELTEICNDTATFHLLEKVLPLFQSKLRMQKKLYDICFYVSLSNSFDSVFAEFSKSLRHNIKKALKRIKRDHKIEFLDYTETGLSVKEAMNVFIKLHSRRWGEKSLLASSDVEGEKCREFHIDVAERFSEKGWLGLYFLSVDDEFVSAKYGFEYGQKMYSYLSGFDPDYSKYSVGNLISYFVLNKLVTKGFIEEDLLRGPEKFKSHWTTKYRQNFMFRLIPNTPLSLLYEWSTRIRFPYLRK
jgi:CelD/BcsL family acetyltransferase involved in cellulose biosynthesis